ncbi:hypothetical protein J4E86_003714 [Alternaria arbusti]|uniref:uncharacterized protein n=1 Tax=Alternaria arbusti TaxID=232088 RepID=UPI00221E9A01|nr:uncharacterized protein J4E86_003714 [Alternaria arbusti]KAI4958118.1 hypothetical protein J4E86_003714 [Alternaria arbusti]
MSPDAKEPRTLLCQITGKTQDRTQEENKDYSIYTVQKDTMFKTLNIVRSSLIAILLYRNLPETVYPFIQVPRNESADRVR